MLTVHTQVALFLDNIPGVAYVVAGVVAGIIFVSKRSKLDAIPTVGSGIWFGTWLDSRRFKTHTAEIIQEGYEKHKPAPFKVAYGYQWLVVLNSKEHMDEVRKAPDDVFLFREAAIDTIKMKYTLGEEYIHSTYHFEVIRSHLNHNIDILYDEIRDEVTMSFRDTLDLNENEWKSIPAMGAVQSVVGRTSNRLFVGLPLCRDPGWLSFNMRFAFHILNGTRMINRFPPFLEPLVAYFITDVRENLEHAMKYLGPIIEERLNQLEAHGKDWAEKLCDILTWLLDVAPEGPERTVKFLTTRVLIINFAALHTTSITFSHTLFFLAENPQYVQPLREEVESVVQKNGWSKASLTKMHKIDSFLRETLRLVGVSSTSLRRKAVKDFTFSDGTFIPKGTTVVSPSQALHHDEENYSNPLVFDPFRFSNTLDENTGGVKQHVVSTSLEFLPFGHGKHACPGRFFAANLLKSMLAHLVVTYDVKLEEGTPRPKEVRAGLSVAPDPTARVMFRNRVH